MSPSSSYEEPLIGSNRSPDIRYIQPRSRQSRANRNFKYQTSINILKDLNKKESIRPPKISATKIRQEEPRQPSNIMSVASSKSSSYKVKINKSEPPEEQLEADAQSNTNNNNNNNNVEDEFPNKIRTSKYTYWNAIPKILLEQFSKVGNIYFLILAILQVNSIIFNII